MENKDMRILVVDDEPTMADSLKQNLAEEGYVVDAAATGTEAIELFDQGGHHVAICDLQLPDMDGLEVVRHIKDAKPLTEVIVLTGHGSGPRAFEASKAGAFDFVEKDNFEFETLLRRIQNALKQRAAYRKRKHATAAFHTLGILQHHRLFEIDADYI